MYRPTHISASAPAVTDDYAHGFRNGNFWWNTTDDILYVLVDHTTGAADWDAVSSSAIASWADWTPTLTWTGNTPVSVSYVARYQMTGNVVVFTLDISATNDSGANITNLTVTLPETPVDNNNNIPVFAFFYVGGACSYSFVAYVDGTSNAAGDRILRHANFVAIAGDASFSAYYSGIYETS